MTNLQPVNDNSFTTRSEVILAWRASNWVDGVKFVSCSTIPNVLPFLKTELGNTRYELAGWLFHVGSRQTKSSLSCSVGSLVIALDDSVPKQRSRRRRASNLCHCSQLFSRKVFHNYHVVNSVAFTSTNIIHQMASSAWLSVISICGRCGRQLCREN